jgi:hypothetical protein
MAFDNAEKAQAWYNVPPMMALSATRIKSTDSLAFIVEGNAKKRALAINPKNQGQKPNHV